MAKANPTKWFPSRHTAQIGLRKVDKWAEYAAKNNGKPYFDTWEEAHAQAVAWAVRGIEHAKQGAAAAKRAIKAAEVRAQKVARLKPPNVEVERRPKGASARTPS